MRKKTIGMVGMLVLFGVLLGVYCLIKPKEVAETPEEEAVTYDVMTVDNTTVSLLEYRIEEAGETYLLNLKSDASGWTWAADTEIPLSNSTITNMVSAVMALTSEYCVEGVTAEALAETYGITSDSLFVRTKDETNGDITLRFGKINSYNSMQYVARDDRPDKVYLIASTVKSSLKAPESMIEQEILPTVEEAKLSAVRYVTGDAEYLYNRETVTDTDEEGEVTTSYVWTRILNGGESETMEDDAGEQVQNAVLSLTYDEALTFHAAEWEAYGVGDVPVSKLTVYYTYTTSLTDSTTEQEFNTEVQTSYVLYLGNSTEDGSFYARLPDGQGVYTVVLNLPTD